MHTYAYIYIYIYIYTHITFHIPFQCGLSKNIDVLSCAMQSDFVFYPSYRYNFASAN